MTTTTATVLTGCLAPEPATAPTGCLAPIDKNGLEALIAAGKANPQVIKTLKCKTVAEGRFRHLNYIRTLPPYIVDEPPGLLGDDTAPNPSEASLAALGSSVRLSSPDPAEKRAQEATCAALIAEAKALGAPVIRVFGGKRPDGVSPEQGIDAAARLHAGASA